MPHLRGPLAKNLGMTGPKAPHDKRDVLQWVTGGGGLKRPAFSPWWGKRNAHTATEKATQALHTAQSNRRIAIWNVALAKRRHMNVHPQSVLHDQSNWLVTAGGWW